MKLQLNGNKLLHHMDRVIDWENGKNIYPIYIAFSPTSLCNHKCVFCVYHYKEFKPIYFPLEQYKKIVTEWSELGVKSLFFAGDGEPLLNKDCVEMISLTRKAGIDVAMNTNARLLDDKKSQSLVNDLDWIRISLNAGSAKNYSKVHGTSEGDFNRVIKNIEGLTKAKKENDSNITIGIQCVLLNENYDEIPALAKKVKELGVDYFSVKPYLKHPLIKYDSKIEDLENKLKKLSELESLSDDNFKFELRNHIFSPDPLKRRYKKCLSGPFMLEVDAKGDLYTCGPYIGDKNHCYGNILNTSFKEVWNSDRKKKVDEWIRENLDVKKCMPNCRPDSVNNFLWELKNPPQHVNYI